LLGGAACPIHYDLVSERKLGIFSKIKKGENYNNRNTLKYFQELPASGGSSFEPDARLGKTTVFGRALFRGQNPEEHTSISRS
jgi:hypothetical protein